MKPLDPEVQKMLEAAPRVCRIHQRWMESNADRTAFWCSHCNHEQRLGYMSDHDPDCKCDLHTFLREHGRLPTRLEMPG